MNVSLSRFRVRPDKVAQVDRWMARLNECREECLATLDREEMKLEVIFRELSNGQEYLHWFCVQGEGGASVQTSPFAIDREHIAFHEECIDHEYGRHDAQPQLVLVPDPVAKAMAWAAPETAAGAFERREIVRRRSPVAAGTGQAEAGQVQAGQATAGKPAPDSIATPPAAVLSPRSSVTLREITQDTVRSILHLKVAPHQEQFVANNGTSLAQAHFAGEQAWYRAVYAEDTPVGFLMLDDDPVKPEYYLWRFMIDHRYQGMGFGRQAIQLLIDHVRTRPQAQELLLSYVPGEGTPQPFYQKLGFVDTGVVEDGEIVMRLDLPS